MESREEILANFQACTGIEDIGEALQHLEDSGWVLVDAVNRAIPGAGQDQGVDPVAQRPGTPVNIQSLEPQPVLLPDNPPSFPQMAPPLQETFSSYLNSDSVTAGSSRQAAGVSIASDFLPIISSSRNRLLELNIEYRDRMIHLKVPDNETIKVVKDLLQAETNVPPCQMELRGWGANYQFPPTDRRLLSELNLPKENFLHLLTPEIPVVEPEPEIIVNEIKLTLRIQDLFYNKMYNLTFADTKLVSDVKRDVAVVTTIPVYRQEWTGWPDDTHDDLSLAQAGVSDNHSLTVNQQPPEPGMPILVRDEEEDEDVIDVSEDEYQDAPEHMDDEDIFVPQSSRSGIQPLLPDDFGDESLAGIKFGEEFANRYGQPAMPFFQGSLDDALNESCKKTSTRDRKMLAVYLHHDSSVLTNVFCTQVLCADAVIGLFLENFVTWGWDLTHSSNKQRLLDMITRHFGSVAASTLRNMSVEKFPVVILIAKLRGNMEILQIIHGNTTLAEFMTEVLSTVENYNQQIGVEQREEQDRNERNYMKEEQERAFQEAQLLDQVKEQERENAEAEARLLEQMDEAKRRSEQEEKERKERVKKEEQDAAKQILPPEPGADDSKPLANIRFRTPSETITRRFYGTDTLSILLTYLASVGYSPSEYKILSSWPRRDISVLDKNSSLADLKLCPQETLTLEAHSPADSDSE